MIIFTPTLLYLTKSKISSLCYNRLNMNSKQFLKQSYYIINYITDYIDNLGQRKVMSDVAPGYLSKLLPTEMPQKGEEFSEIFKDLEDKLMPGIVHWGHPHFHGYLPSSRAYPSILADMMSSSLGGMSFSWLAGPALVELEVAMTDWLGLALGLPSFFMNSEAFSDGGGIMASSASECVLLTLLSARLQAINHLKPFPSSKQEEEDSVYLPRLVAYCSDEAHSCVEKAAHVAMVQLRILQTNTKHQLSPETLRSAIKKDLAKGLHPCYVVVTLGTTSSGAFDSLKDIAPIVRNIPGCWLHVNAAFGGNNFICPELRKPLAGIELADSFCVNPYKGLLMNIDSTCLWVRNRVAYCTALMVDPVYLAHNLADPFLDHRHWSLWLSRRFRSLKIWYTFRLYGVEGLQAHVRKMLRMARAFARFVDTDRRFELCNEVDMPLVCFRLLGSDGLNHELLSLINGSGKLLLTPAVLNSQFVLRFVVGHEDTDEDLIMEAWDEVVRAADQLRPDTVRPVPSASTFRRLSFTRRVSFLDYRRWHPKTALKDIDTPVFIPVLMIPQGQKIEEGTHL